MLVLSGVSPVSAQEVSPADTVIDYMMRRRMEEIPVGYGMQRKDRVAGAVSAVQRWELKDGRTPDAATALEGRAAGVRVLTPSGAPGTVSSILIRGYQLDNDTAVPLYVVDGLPVSDIGYLDPEMIESVSVLKDAASSAIYGVRGRNGVILITTRKGGGRGASVFYDNRVSLSTLARRPDLMNAQEYIQSGKAGGWLTDDMLNSVGYSGQDTNWAGEAFGPAWG